MTIVTEITWGSWKREDTPREFVELRRFWKSFSQSAAEGEWVVGPEEGLTLVQRVRQLLLVRLRQQHCGQTHLQGNHQSEISEGKVRRPTAKVMLPKTKMGRTG